MNGNAPDPLAFFSPVTKPGEALPATRRFGRELRRDLMRLDSDEAWEEMLFSLSVVLTIFGALAGFLEFRFGFFS